MISLNLKKAFDNLNINDKKDKLSSEIMFIAELLKRIKIYYGLDTNVTVKNYNINSQMSNEEFLSFIYEDVFEIQKQLLLILYSLQKQ